MSAYPVQYLAQYSEERNRLTVFFRGFIVFAVILLLIIPALVLYFVVSISLTIAWLAVVITGRYPEGLYNFHAGLLRYSSRLNAYFYLQTDAFPPLASFDEEPGYPVQTRVAPPLPEYNRVKALFRIFLMIPVFIIAYALSIVSQFCAFAAWFVIVITGKLPRGLFDGINLGLSYTAKATAYYMLLTEEWPPFSDEQASGQLFPPVNQDGTLGRADDTAWSPQPASTTSGSPSMRKEL